MKKLAFLLVVIVAGCSPSMSRLDQRAKEEFNRGNFAGAAMSLDPVDPATAGKDRLLFCMDRGIIMHTAGRYQDSNAYLLEASETTKDMQPIRTGEEVSTFLLNENAAEYKGEDYERLLILAYVSMNFALMGNLEQARAACAAIDVEMRRINDIRQKDFASAKPGQDPESQQWCSKHAQLWEARNREYAHLNAFATYLSAILYEAMGDVDNSYIFYKRAYAMEPGFPYLAEDLIRTSRGNREEHEQWKRQLGREDATVDWKTMGEVVVIFQAGRAPVKVPAPDFPYVPASRCIPSGTQFGQIYVNGQPHDRTYTLDNIEAQAVITLQEQDAAVRVKRIAALILKHGVAEAVGHENQTAGLLLHIFAEVSEQPDLRCWETLPRDLQIARVPLAPGTYNLAVEVVGPGGQLRCDNIVVKPGGHVFVTLRSIW